jgi:hypothetical protein
MRGVIALQGGEVIVIIVGFFHPTDSRERSFSMQSEYLRQ